jgi:hypothetical protein
VGVRTQHADRGSLSDGRVAPQSEIGEVSAHGMIPLADSMGRVNDMSRITIAGAADDTFDDANLTAAYRAEWTPDGGLDVVIDIFEGPQLKGTLPITHYEATQVDGFHEA